MAMQSQFSDDHNKLPGKRPRLMIDISPELRRRIKIAAAQKDLSIREYVEDILDQAVPPEEEASKEKRQPRPVSRESLERLLRTREQIIQERQGPRTEIRVKLGHRGNGQKRQKRLAASLSHLVLRRQLFRSSVIFRKHFG
jgi:hypothetical protein